VIERPQKVETQIKSVPDTKICAVDLNINEHLAACTVQTVEGTVLATRFIGGGKELHGLRKKQLGRIARNRNKTGIIAKGEQDNAARWTKIRAIDEDTAHQVSHRIVQFAQAQGASVLVFEHLANFKPQKGSYGKRGNEKRSYWLRGRIFKYARYKAYNEGIVTCRVNPKNTSRECAHCGTQVARYNAGQPAEGYTPGASLVFCSQCQMRGNSDRNASIVIGQRLISRYHRSSQEKPQAPLRAERPAQAGGVTGSQVAQDAGRPSINRIGHGTGDGLGTTQEASQRMASDTSGIPVQLRLFNE
jgi:IS605 OrfB family transposase